ncbi:MAG: SdpI family protein [Oscillospiraceae bacterium]|nr:SdpI family protein [Oscillospiraceae bacterium]
MYKYKKTLIICSILCLLPILAGLYFWNDLPDMMVTHWDAYNQPDGYMPKAFAVFGLPLIMVAVLLLCPLASKIDPKKPKYNDKIMLVMFWFIPVLSVLCSTMTYGWALGISFDIGFWISMFLGIIFALIGNYLPKCTPSYTMGIKLPWTLNDDENWRKTHRMAGPVWVVGGIIIALSALLKMPWLMFPVLLAMIFIPTIYSYLYYRKHNK